MATTSGAMSLMDKYASINSNIEDARRRVASTRANVDAMNLKIQHLRENRAEMIDQTNDANAEASKLKAELEKYAEEQRAKIAEKNRVERENNIAKCGYNDTKNLIDKERREFLERCREFRTSCRKNRAAASILVLDRGGNFEARDAIDEIDLWRKLQEEDLSDGGEDKKNDSELDEAEKKEKESRQYYIEAECRLHTTRSEHESATTRCSARRVKLTQQRAQLERHRNELEELERERVKRKDEVVEANELAKTFEKECQRRQQIHRNNLQASYSNNFNHAPQESTMSDNNPYRRNSQTTNNMPVSNPYNRAITPNAPTNTTTNNPYRPRNGNGGVSSSHRYASDLMNEVTPHQYGNNRSSQQSNTNQRPNQHQGGSRASRHNRQFGTNIGVSSTMDSEMTDELRECMAAFSTDNNYKSNSDDLSVSSNSSSDDEILSFNIFGKK